MNWNDVKGVIGDVAPVVGTLIGGPAGAAVGGLVAKYLGTDSTPEAVAQAVKNNPDAALKLQQLLNDAEFQRLQNEIAKEQIQADLQKNEDNNTTQRWLSDNTAGGLPAITRPLLVWVIVFAYLLMAVFDGNMGDFKIKATYLNMLDALLPLVVTAYMGLRTYEKAKGVQNDDVKVIKQ